MYFKGHKLPVNGDVIVAKLFGENQPVVQMPNSPERLKCLAMKSWSCRGFNLRWQRCTIIYTAINALSRHLVIDVQMVTDNFLLSITAAIVLLCLATFILSYTSKKFGNPEDDSRYLEKDSLEEC